MVFRSPMQTVSPRWSTISVGAVVLRAGRINLALSAPVHQRCFAVPFMLVIDYICTLAVTLKLAAEAGIKSLCDSSSTEMTSSMTSRVMVSRAPP